MTTEQIEEQKETFIAPGQLLKEAREALNLSHEDISSRLKLRVEVLQQIEEDKFDMGKLATFTRGYYRSYAKLVNVSEIKVLNALDHLGKAQIEQHDMQSFSRKTKRDRHDNRIMKLTWVISVLIISMSVLWWWQEQTQLETDAVETQSQEQMLDKVDEISVQNELISEEFNALESTDEEALRDNDVSEASNEAIDNTKVASDPIVEPEQPIIEESVSSTDTVSSKPIETADVILTDDLIMTFQDDCWLQVQDADKKRLYSGVKKSNQTLKLTGKAPYKLVIGAPTAVTLTYKGKPVDLSVYPAGKVARLTLPQ